jgi:hypothetical protein
MSPKRDQGRRPWRTAPPEAASNTEELGQDARDAAPPRRPPDADESQDGLDLERETEAATPRSTIGSETKRGRETTLRALGPFVLQKPARSGPIPKVLRQWD